MSNSRSRDIEVVEEALFALRVGDDLSAVYHLWRVAASLTKRVLGLELFADFWPANRSLMLVALLEKLGEVRQGDLPTSVIPPSEERA